MRVWSWAAAGAVLACGSHGTSSSAVETVEAGSDGGPPCLPGAISFDGSSDPAPSGSFEMANVAFTSNSLSATFPAGGMIALHWSGDATAGPVSVTGQMVLPQTEGRSSSWCVASTSTLRLDGHTGTANLQAADGADVRNGPSGTCLSYAQAGAPKRVPTIEFEACFVTP